MGLFGGKTTVQLHLDRTDVVAGDEVTGVLRIGEPDKKVQGGRIELAYRNTFQEDTTDSEGDTSTATRREDVVLLSQAVSGPEGVQAGERRFALPLPADAPGTSAGSVDWFVRVVLDRKMGSDVDVQVPFGVGAPAQPLQAWAERPVTCPPQCPMAFELPTRVLRPGDTVHATLTLRPTEPLSARAVRVRLRRVREDKDGNTDASTFGEVEAAHDVDVPAGGAVDVPFSVQVPPGAPPSFQAAHNRQAWYVEAVLDRKRAADYIGRLEVVVANA